MMANGWGGAREGAGNKPADYVPTEDKVELENQRARHEKIKADQREFKLAQGRGEYVSRAAIRQASARIDPLLSRLSARSSIPRG